MRHIALFALLLAGGAFATPPPASALDDSDLLAHLSPGSRIEARVDADLTGDGRTDTAFVGGNEAEGEYVLVVLGARKDGSFGVLGRESYAWDGLGPPSLRATRKGVLVLEELLGGSTATQGTYRYRWDRKRGAMRLIGLDAARYSRTNAHDAFELSWNLLTGDVIARQRVLDGEGGYVERPAERWVQRSVPVLLGATPDAAGLIEAELAERHARAREDRD